MKYFFSFMPLLLAATLYAVPVKKVFTSEIQTQITKNALLNIEKTLIFKHNEVVASLKNILQKYQTNKNINAIHNINIYIRKALLSKNTNAEYYEISKNINELNISSGTTAGLIAGISTLEELLKKGKGALSFRKIYDWPSIKTRALHLVIRGSENINDMKDLISLARQNHFNTLILMIANGVSFNSLNELSNKQSWTKKQLKSFILFAKHNGFTVIPELKLLTHQEKFLANKFPSLMFNKTTYNPSNKEVYKKIFPLIDEVIELFESNILHIGHDELAGYKHVSGPKAIRIDEKGLDIKFFHSDIINIYNYTKQKNIRLMMWGDMLIPVKDFSQLAQRNLEITKNTDFNKLRRKIPKDIIICYHNYRSTKKEFKAFKIFMKEGFTTYGATWKKHSTILNFSKYVAENFSENSAMIATTWYIPTAPKTKKTVIDIIQFSGEAFWNAQ